MLQWAELGCNGLKRLNGVKVIGYNGLRYATSYNEVMGYNGIGWAATG